MNNVNQVVEYSDKKIFFGGKTGKYGELEIGSLWVGERPVVSLTSDMGKVKDFDGLIAINTQGELAQLLGVYFHGEIYPYTWKLLADDLVKYIHLAVGKGCATRVIFNRVKCIDLREGGYIEIGKEKKGFCFDVAGTLAPAGTLNNPALGSDTELLKVQGKVLFETIRFIEKGVKFVMGKPLKKNGHFGINDNLRSKVDSHPVLVPIK